MKRSNNILSLRAFGVAGLFLWFLLTGIAYAWSQTAFTLEACRNLAREEAAALRQLELTGQIANARQQLLKKIICPELWGYGLVAYLSDMPDPASALAYAFDFSPVPHDHYKGGLFLNQNLYTGGEYRYKKEEIRLNADMEELQTEENLLLLDNLVDDIFLSTILVRQAFQIQSVQLERVCRHKEEARYLLEEGRLLRKDLLQAEMAVLDLESRLEALRAEEATFREQLSELTGRELQFTDELILPGPSVNDGERTDPAFIMIDLQEKQNRLARKISRTTAMPRVQLFGTAGYGKPGLDFFSDGSDWYSGIGLFVRVPLTAWRDHTRQDKILQIEADCRAEYRNRLQQKRNLLEAQYSGELRQHTVAVEQQGKKIALLEQLRGQMELLLKEGEVSLSEYLSVLDEETASRLSREASEIARIKAALQRNRILVNQTASPGK
jgi:outer membrane protein TolC